MMRRWMIPLVAPVALAALLLLAVRPRSTTTPAPATMGTPAVETLEQPVEVTIPTDDIVALAQAILDREADRRAETELDGILARWRASDIRDGDYGRLRHDLANLLRRRPELGDRVAAMFFASSDPRFLMAAALALTAVADGPAVETLRSAAIGGDALHQEYALVGMMGRGDERSREVVRRHYDPAGDPKLAATAAMALISTVESIPAAERSELRERSRRIAQSGGGAARAALQLLAELGIDDDDTEWLARLTESPDSAVALAAGRLVAERRIAQGRRAEAEALLAGLRAVHCPEGP